MHQSCVDTEISKYLSEISNLQRQLELTCEELNYANWKAERAQLEMKKLEKKFKEAEERIEYWRRRAPKEYEWSTDKGASEVFKVTREDNVSTDASNDNEEHEFIEGSDFEPTEGIKCVSNNYLTQSHWSHDPVDLSVYYEDQVIQLHLPKHVACPKLHTNIEMKLDSDPNKELNILMFNHIISVEN